MEKFLEYWVGPFEDAPVVDLYGIVSNSGSSAYSRIPESDLWSYQWEFEAWKLKDQPVQTLRLEVRFAGSEEEILAFTGPQGRFQKHKVVHIKARLTHDPDGYPMALYEEWMEPTPGDAALNELQMRLGQPTAALNLPALPELTASEYSWVGDVELDFWDGFSTPQDFNWGMNNACTGTVALELEKLFEDQESVEEHDFPPTPAQISALRYLIENQDSLSEAVLNKIFNSYPEWRTQYSGDPEYMPEVSTAPGLKNLLRPSTIHISRYEKEGFSYVIFYFECHWDVEHGFGVTTHKSRILSATDSAATFDAIQHEIDASGS